MANGTPEVQNGGKSKVTVVTGFLSAGAAGMTSWLIVNMTTVATMEAELAHMKSEIVRVEQVIVTTTDHRYRSIDAEKDHKIFDVQIGEVIRRVGIVEKKTDRCWDRLNRGTD